MPETEISKMKVADLKRELKMRGLPITGNKNELQDRLQSAIVDGDLLSDDIAIAGDDSLDEDAVLTDEADENELLHSPISEKPKSSIGVSSTTIEEDILESTTSNAPKKVILKRKNPLLTNITTSATQATTPTLVTKENTEPSPPKVAKINVRKTITIEKEENNDDNKGDDAKSTRAKWLSLSWAERLEMRSQKFGTNVKSNPKQIADYKNTNDKDELEKLKKRAERFGCVTASKIVEIKSEEKLLKRKERFAASDGGDTNSSNNTANSSDYWAEKANKRLERFKIIPPTTATATE